MSKKIYNGNKIVLKSKKFLYKEILINKIDFNEHVNAIKLNFIHHFDALLLYNFFINIVKKGDVLNVALTHDILLYNYGIISYFYEKNSWFMFLQNIIWPK